MITLAAIWKLLAALSLAFTAWEKFQGDQQAATTDQVDTLADQGAADATAAKTPEDFQKASQELHDALAKS